MQRLMQLLFSFDRAETKAKYFFHQQTLFLDSSPKTIKMISRLLNRISSLPIVDSPTNMLIFETVGQDQQQDHGVVYKSLSEVLNQCLMRFTDFFKQDFKSLTVLSKIQRQDLTLIIKKIQYIVNVSLSCAQNRKTKFQNICQEDQLNKVLEIVQAIINAEN